MQGWQLLELLYSIKHFLVVHLLLICNRAGLVQMVLHLQVT